MKTLKCKKCGEEWGKWLSCPKAYNWPCELEVVEIPDDKVIGFEPVCKYCARSQCYVGKICECSPKWGCEHEFINVPIQYEVD